MIKADIIELLNEALQCEYTDVFLYPREADLVREREISAQFAKFGAMELRHADNIAMQIRTLGGKPYWDFMPLDSNKTLNDILLYHLGKEEKCIKVYDNLINVADEEGQEQLKLLLKGIKSEEEMHLKAIKEFVEKTKAG